MKNKKFLFISLLILAIGFASVSTILYITGTLAVQTNETNFDVYFSGAILDGEDKTNLFVKDKKHIVYKTNDLMKVGDISELEYEVTNGSNQYDADVEITCTPTTTDYYTVTTVPSSLTVEAGKVESGKIKVELIKYSTEIIEETIECELVANAVERTSTGDDVATIGDYAIEGILKDKDGNILPKTELVVYSETPHEVTTDRNGYFYVSGLEKGLHEIYLKTDADITDKEATKEASSFGAILTTNNVYKITKGEYKIDEHDTGLELEDKSNYCEYEIGYKWNFNYTGSEQKFESPCDGKYKVELWGASGGNGSGTNMIGGGYGGYTSGNIELEQESKLYLYVGQAGSGINNTNSWNGGGYKGSEAIDGAGGGATDIRLVNGTWNNFDSLKSRIMVAGAGGGSDDGNETVTNASPAGGLIGYSYIRPGYDGVNTTQISSGYSNSATHNYGGFGYANQTLSSTECGGGSGYYGGSSSDIGSIGGTSFISGHNGCDAIKEESTASNIIHTGQSIHYSGLKFTDTVMIDGRGYNWTDIKGSYVGQVQPDGSTAVGHTGNGYARITYLGE